MKIALVFLFFIWLLLISFTGIFWKKITQSNNVKSTIQTIGKTHDHQRTY